MENGKRVEAPNGVNRGEGVSGTPPAPRQGLLRGRQVRGIPKTEPSPSAAQPHATQESAGLRRCLRSRVARGVGTAGCSSQPYSVAERPWHSGASGPSEGGASAASVQGPRRPEAELPGGFDWLTVYRDIKFQRQRNAQLGDVNALAAIDEALREIDRAVTSALARHTQARCQLEQLPPEEAMRRLRRRRKTAAQRGQQDRCTAVDQSLGEIYRLTHAKAMQLKARDEELRSPSLRHAFSAPDRQALGRWLRSQAGAAHEAEIERSYFTQLARDLADGLDPWTVSQRLIRHLAESSYTDQVGRLQAAHRRLVEAMAGRLSPRATPSDPGGTELPRCFNWSTAYRNIELHGRTATQCGDVYAAAACAGAMRMIGEAMTAAFIGHHKYKTALEQPSPRHTLSALQKLQDTAKSRDRQHQVSAIDRSLDDIYRLTHAKSMELKARSDELSAAAPPQPVAVPGQQALGQWLRGQADATPESDIEHSYFTQLAQELAQQLDPWTLSRRLMGRLPVPGDADQAERLRGAHRRLVQAMAGNPPPQTPPRPCPPAAVEPLLRESQASASRRQEMVQRLSSGNRLLEAQVEAFRCAVAEAAATGAIGDSGSRPEAWAMGLLERIQQTVERPIAGLTDLEMHRIPADWKRFGELLDNLESARLL